MQDLINKVKSNSVYSKDKSDLFGEVFTPTPLIIQMLKSLDKAIWYDSSKKWFDPCAGKGNFGAVIVTKLMITLKKIYTDEDIRYKHIMENMIYMAEYQRESAILIKQTFDPDNCYNLNIYIGDTLRMPEDFFDLSYLERKNKYPFNCL